MEPKSVLQSTSTSNITWRFQTRDSQCSPWTKEVERSMCHQNSANLMESQIPSETTVEPWDNSSTLSSKTHNRRCNLSNRWFKSFSRWRNGLNGTSLLMTSLKNFKVEDSLHQNYSIKRELTSISSVMKDFLSRCQFSKVSSRRRLSSWSMISTQDRRQKAPRELWSNAKDKWVWIAPRWICANFLTAEETQPESQLPSTTSWEDSSKRRVLHKTMLITLVLLFSTDPLSILMSRKSSLALVSWLKWFRSSLPKKWIFQLLQISWSKSTQR